MYLGLCGLRSLLRHRGGTSRHYHERIPRTKSRKESTERKTSSMFHTRSRWTWWFYTKRDHHQGNPWSWANFAGLAQLYAMPDGQHQTALGQCRYVDHKKKYFRNFNFNFNYRELLSKSATFSLRSFGVVTNQIKSNTSRIQTNQIKSNTRRPRNEYK